MKSRKTLTDNYYFTKRMFYHLLVPSLLASFTLGIGNIVDAVVVGARMGETGLAAIALVTPLYMIYNIFAAGVAVGGSIKYAQLLGAGQAKEAVRNFNLSFYCSLGISILIGGLGLIFLKPFLLFLGTKPNDGLLFSYTYDYVRIMLCAAPLFFLDMLFYFFIRNDDGQKTATIAFVVENTADFVLNFVFVLGLSMGVKGAILATVAGKLIGLLIYATYFLNKYAILKFRRIRFDFSIVCRNMKNGLSSSSQYLFQFVVILCMNHLAFSMLGERGVAVYGVILNISYLAMALYQGLCDTIQPLCGTFFGENNKESEQKILRLALIIGSALGCAAVFILCVFPAFFCNMFGVTDMKTIQIGIVAVRLYAVSILFAGISVMMSSYYQCTFQERMVMLINLLRNFIFYLLYAVIFFLLGKTVFWWLFPTIEVTSLCIWIFFRKYLKTFLPLQQLEDERILHCTVFSDQESFENLTKETFEFCNKWNVSKEKKYYVNLVTEELIQIIIKHGYSKRDDCRIDLTLIAYDDGDFTLRLRDNAVRFNPFEMKAKRAERIEDVDMDSVGILMVKKQAKEFFYRQYQGFNNLQVRI